MYKALIDHGFRTIQNMTEKYIPRFSLEKDPRIPLRSGLKKF